MTETKILNDKKISVSGYRVLELLKALSEKPLSSQEMLEILEEKTNNVYRKELVTKYLNTLKLIGFDIEKNKDKYILKKGLKQIDFSYNDLSVLNFLSQYVNEIPIENLQRNLHIVMDIVQKSCSEDTLVRINNSTIKPYVLKNQVVPKNEFVEKYEKYCTEGLKLTIKYKNNQNGGSETYKILPIKIVYKKRKIFLIAYDCVNNEYKEFLSDLVLSEEQTPQKSSQCFASTVTFKLTGRLGKSYVLKSNEQILESNKDYIIVSNTKEDKTILVRRLARYYDKCEILYPKSYREEMVSYLESIESVYQDDF